MVLLSAMLARAILRLNARSPLASCRGLLPPRPLGKRASEAAADARLLGVEKPIP